MAEVARSRGPKTAGDKRSKSPRNANNNNMRPLRKTQCTPSASALLFSPSPSSNLDFGMSSSSSSNFDTSARSLQEAFSEGFFLFDTTKLSASASVSAAEEPPRRRVPLREPSGGRGRSHSPVRRTVTHGGGKKQRGPSSLEALARERRRMSLMLGDEEFPPDDVSAFLGDFSVSIKPEEDGIDFVSPVGIEDFPGVNIAASKSEQRKKEGIKSSKGNMSLPQRSPQMKAKDGVKGLKKLRKLMGGSDVPSSAASVTAADALEKSAIVKETEEITAKLKAVRQRKFIQQPESQATSATSATSFLSEETMASSALKSHGSVASSPWDTQGKPLSPRRSSIQKLKNFIRPVAGTIQFHQVEGAEESFSFLAAPNLADDIVNKRESSNSLMSEASSKSSKTSSSNNRRSSRSVASEGSRKSSSKINSKNSSRSLASERRPRGSKNKKSTSRKQRKQTAEAPPPPPATSATKPTNATSTKTSSNSATKPAKPFSNQIPPRKERHSVEEESQASLSFSDLQLSYGSFGSNEKKERFQNSSTKNRSAASVSSSSPCDNKASKSTNQSVNSNQNPRMSIKELSSSSSLDSSLDTSAYTPSTSSSYGSRSLTNNESTCLLDSLPLDTVHENQNEDCSEATSRHTTKSFMGEYYESPKQSYRSFSSTSARSIPEDSIMPSPPDSQHDDSEIDSDNVGHHGRRSIGRMDSVGDIVADPPVHRSKVRSLSPNKRGEDTANPLPVDKRGKTPVPRKSQSKKGSLVGIAMQPQSYSLNDLSVETTGIKNSLDQRSSAPSTSKKRQSNNRNLAGIAMQPPSCSLNDVSVENTVIKNQGPVEREPHYAAHPHQLVHTHRPTPSDQQGQRGNGGGGHHHEPPEIQSARSDRHDDSGYSNWTYGQQHWPGDSGAQRSRGDSLRRAIDEFDEDFYIEDDSLYSDAYGRESSSNRYAYDDEATAFQHYNRQERSGVYRDAGYQRQHSYRGMGTAGRLYPFSEHAGGWYDYAHPWERRFVNPRMRSVNRGHNYSVREPEVLLRGRLEVGGPRDVYRYKHGTGTVSPCDYDREIPRRGQLRRRHSLGSGHSRDSIMDEISVAMEQEYKMNWCSHCGQLVSHCDCSISHYSMEHIVDYSTEASYHSRRRRMRPVPRDLETRLTSSGAKPGVSLFETFGIKYLDPEFGDRSVARRALDNETHPGYRAPPTSVPLYHRPEGFDVNEYVNISNAERLVASSRLNHRGRKIRECDSNAKDSSMPRRPGSANTADDKRRAYDDGSLRYPRTFDSGGNTSGRTQRSFVVDDASVHSFAI